MSSLGFWSVIMILYQTFICVIVSWLTLSCRLAPEPDELHELTLMKLLYLYEPEACERTFFYNYTGVAFGNIVNTVVWPLKNDVAASFRSKIQISLFLHILWAVLSIINQMTKEQPCAYYTVLMPFTMTGLSMIILDLVHGALFLIDAKYTGDERSLLNYLNYEKDNIKFIYMKNLDSSKNVTTDTSWISVVFAYISLRGIVQMIINFWIVKDNYVEGTETYRKLQASKHLKKDFTSRSSEYLHI